MLLLVNDQQPYKTLKEFIDDAKKRPDSDRLQFGRALRRDPSAARAVSRRRPAYSKLRHLPTNGGGPAITAILGNNAQMHAQIGVRDASSISRPANCARWPSFGATRSRAIARRADTQRTRL